MDLQLVGRTQASEFEAGRDDDIACTAARLGTYDTRP